MTAICLTVRAYSVSEALEVAKEANEQMCNGGMSYFLTEQLAFGKWVVILAHNEDDALQAKDKFYEEQD